MIFINERGNFCIEFDTIDSADLFYQFKQSLEKVLLEALTSDDGVAQRPDFRWVLLLLTKMNVSAQEFESLYGQQYPTALPTNNQNS